MDLQIFKKIFERTVELEGGFSDDKHDKGGKTKYGVCWNYDAIYLQKIGINSEDQMISLSLDQAETIHLEKYWKNWRFHYLAKLPLCAATTYDMGFHEGKYGWCSVQQVINNLMPETNLVIDGAPGPKTKGAVSKLYQNVIMKYPNKFLNDHNIAVLIEVERAEWYKILMQQDIEDGKPLNVAWTYYNSGMRRLGRLGNV
jgi:lysozyme family protein